ncbi:MAG: GH25 family lysozyme [Phreatobacter sp.]|uniref:glycoside hydrolase family 25 protein n=1 Tax=Phreatobacter sp. TaxID=1966341 RepID=UPI0027348C1C|nr:GH25 family lysozyme [Phreatobacter sp.]MDP2803980.1 GH25 family lysozyme [Phreatobacter sp.]
MTRRSIAFASVTLMGLMLAGCGSVPTDVAAPQSSGHPFPTLTHTVGHHVHPVHGIDVSKYQGAINWEQVRAAGVSFAFIKATEGGDLLDTRFRENWEASRRAGVPRGAYHFTYWCRPMADQIAWFKRHVPIEPDALPPVLDVEWNFQSPTCPRRVPVAVAQAKMREFLHAMERHYGKKPIIYADIKFHREVLASNEFAEYPFWVRSVAAVPQDRYPGRRWAFWQITATGRVAGVNTPVDRNVFAGTREQWQQIAQTGFRYRGQPVTAVAAAPASSAQPIAFAAAETSPAQVPTATTSVPAAAIPASDAPAMSTAPVPASRPRF